MRISFTSVARLSAFAVMLAAANTASAGLVDQLQVYYQFNGNGADSSGNGRDVGLFGGVGFASGLFGQALDLHHDSSQYAQRPIDDQVLDFGSGDFTIQVWVNFNSTATEQVLIEKFEGAGPPGWSFGKFPNGVLHLSTQPVFTDPLATSTGVWRQILARRSGSVFELGIDGVFVAAANAVGLSDSTVPLLIGKRTEADGRNFGVDGRIDEVAIWTRALSNDEIGQLYNGGQGMEIPAAAVPEPATLASMGFGGVAALIFAARRRAARPSVDA